MSMVSSMSDPNRMLSETVKIPREVTGLAGAIFVHVDRDESGRVRAVRYSHKWKGDWTLDCLLSALGDAVTTMVK